MKRVIGIDPGLYGGVVAIDADGDDQQIVAAFATPLLTGMRKGKAIRDYDVRAMYNVLCDVVYGAPNRPVLIVLERASTRPGQHAQAVLRTGEGYGLWRGLAHAFPVVIQYVLPQVWKRRACLIHADKRASVGRAKERFPALARLTATQHGIAEAALIASHAC